MAAKPDVENISKIGVYQCRHGEEWFLGHYISLGDKGVQRVDNAGWYCLDSLDEIRGPLSPQPDAAPAPQAESEAERMAFELYKHDSPILRKGNRPEHYFQAAMDFIAFRDYRRKRLNEN